MGYDADYCHFINFSTSRMKEKIDEGNFLFSLGVSVNEEINYRVAFQDASVFGTSLNYVSSSPQFGRVFDLVKTQNSDRYNNDDSDIIRMTSERKASGFIWIRYKIFAEKSLGFSSLSRSWYYSFKYVRFLINCVLDLITQ